MTLEANNSAQPTPADRLNTDLIPREAALRLLRVIVVSGSLLTLCLGALLWLLL